MTDASDLWRKHLLLTITGTPKPLLANAITALREAPAWQHVLAYDQFAMETIVSGAPPWDFKSIEWYPRAWASHDDRAGSGCLNRFSASISGVSAVIRPPSGVAAG